MKKAGYKTIYHRVSQPHKNVHRIGGIDNQEVKSDDLWVVD